jgi:hypothetical protein
MFAFFKRKILRLIIKLVLCVRVLNVNVQLCDLRRIVVKYGRTYLC